MVNILSIQGWDKTKENYGQQNQEGVAKIENHFIGAFIGTYSTCDTRQKQ